MKFIKLSKYALSLVSNPRDQMSHFVKRVSEDLQEEFQSSILHDNMIIFCLMVHATRVDEARDKRKSRYAKRARSYDGSSSRNRLEIQDKPRFNSQVLIKCIPNSQKLVVIGCLTLNSRGKKVQFTNREVNLWKVW